MNVNGVLMVNPKSETSSIGKTITVGFRMLVPNAKGVGSRFRATTNHVEDVLSENDSRPLLQNATLIHLPMLSHRDGVHDAMVVSGSVLDFGFRVLNLFRISVFGFRASDWRIV